MNPPHTIFLLHPFFSALILNSVDFTVSVNSGKTRSFVLFFGALVRIFTTIEETGDGILLLTYLCTATLNGLIAGQVLWYWNADRHKKKD
jgi:hypothetical protein